MGMATQIDASAPSFVGVGDEDSTGAEANQVESKRSTRRSDPFVAAYLQEIRRFPLLTKDKEQHVGRRVVKSRGSVPPLCA